MNTFLLKKSILYISDLNKTIIPKSIFLELY